MSRRHDRPNDLGQRASSLLHASRHDHDATSQQRAAVRKALAERLSQGSGSMLATKTGVGMSAGKLTLLAGGAVLAVLSAAHWSTSRNAGPPRATSVALAPAPVTLPADRATDSLTLSEARIEASDEPTARSAEREPLPATRRTSAQSADAGALKAAAPALKSSASGNERQRGRHADSVTRESQANHALRTSRHEPPAPLEHSTGQPQLTPPSPQPPAARVPPSQMAVPMTSQALAPRGVADRPEAANELALMQRIQVALNKGDPQRAYRLSEEHAARWPNGSFQQEREAVSALASCQLRLPEGAERARIFLARYAHSALAPRVRSECPLSNKPRR